MTGDLPRCILVVASAARVSLGTHPRTIASMQGSSQYVGFPIDARAAAGAACFLVDGGVTDGTEQLLGLGSEQSIVCF